MGQMEPELIFGGLAINQSEVEWLAILAYLLFISCRLAYCLQFSHAGIAEKNTLT